MGFDWIPAKNYKRHYICLACKKGFKRPSKNDLKEIESIDFSELMDVFYASSSAQDIISFISESHEKIKVTCPNCSQIMLQVHYNFEVPAMRDTKAWNALKVALGHKTKIDLSAYIYWHKLQLQKASVPKEQTKLLVQNLALLEPNYN